MPLSACFMLAKSLVEHRVCPVNGVELEKSHYGVFRVGALTYGASLMNPNPFFEWRFSFLGQQVLKTFLPRIECNH